MDLRNLPPELDAKQRTDERRKRLEDELSMELNTLETQSSTIGDADEKNCEQMFGMVGIPVGYAGPLHVKSSDHEHTAVHLPLATTEGALVASVNRGCKALTAAGGVQTSVIHHGISRSIAIKKNGIDAKQVTRNEQHWIAAAESTSNHLNILSHHIDETDDHLFLTLNANTDEAMGMNMITIAAEAAGTWICTNIGGELITIAANVDSDKKPSKRTRDLGRGYEVTATATLSQEIISSILKSDTSAMAAVAKAKLEEGSTVAEALGTNMHAANIIAALYLATGQDAAHVVEGSLAQTDVQATDDSITITTRSPAILVGIRGGGTGLPAQSQCLNLLLGKHQSCASLAEYIGAAVLAGELSLLAAQAAGHLARAHRELGR